MPPGEDPIGADDQRVRVIVQVQGGDGRATGRRAAVDAESVPGPLEVIGPSLVSRVEERDQLAGCWVGRGGAVALGSVAERAAQLEVRLLVGPAACQGDGVLDFETGHDEPLRTRAVTATMAGRLADA